MDSRASQVSMLNHKWHHCCLATIPAALVTESCLIQLTSSIVAVQENILPHKDELLNRVQNLNEVHLSKRSSHVSIPDVVKHLSCQSFLVVGGNVQETCKRQHMQCSHNRPG